MLSFLTYRVFLSKYAYKKIKRSVANTQNRYEVGGILLGYKFWSWYYIIDITVPSKIVNKSAVSFFLNGEHHTEQAQRIIKKFHCAPSVIGVWHSHTCNITTFSKRDRRSNKQFAASFGETLSIIVTFSNLSKKLKLSTYFITTKGTECRCQTYIVCNYSGRGIFLTEKDWSRCIGGSSDV